MKVAEKNLRAGAALVESCLAIIMLCLILFGILQISYLVAAKDVVSFSAFAGCRAATVGMKEEFVNRVVRVTSIPMAGPMVGNPFAGQGLNAGGSEGQTWNRALWATPSSDQYWAEKQAIPYYLGAVNEGDLRVLLNYYNWLSTGTLITSSTRRTEDDVEVFVSQNIPLAFPFARAFYRGNMGNMVRQNGTQSVPRSPMNAELRTENHSALYLTRP